MMIVGSAELFFTNPLFTHSRVLKSKVYVGVKLFMTPAIFMNEKVKSGVGDFLTLCDIVPLGCTSLSRETQIILLKFFSKTLLQFCF